jgi:capsid assembly protease
MRSRDGALIQRIEYLNISSCVARGGDFFPVAVLSCAVPGSSGLVPGTHCSMTQLAHIADRVLNRPLMVMPDKLAMIASILEGRIGIDAVQLKGDAEALPLPDASRHVGTFEPDPTSSTGAKKPYPTTKDGTAIVPIIGSLVGRGGWISALSGIASYENLKFQISAAAKDPAVKSVILDIDSPGGEAVGAFETADVVRAAAAVKPVVAVAAGLCCSAAYAIASAATRIITTKSSVVGSIGVVMLHADYSHKLHEAGVKPTLIHAGKKKVDGNPYTPLTDDVKASLKAELDRFQNLFVATVAEGRKGRLTKKAIYAMEAGTYIGADAVAIGLADAVGSLEEVLARSVSRSPVAPASPPSRGFLSPYGRSDQEAAVAIAIDRVTAIMSSAEARGLEAAAWALAAMPPEKISVQGALELLRTARISQPIGRRAKDSPFGLVIGTDYSPASGGMVVSVNADRRQLSKDNFGWGDVVAELNGAMDAKK